MKLFYVVVASFLAAGVASAQIPVARVAEDGNVIDRVAEVSKRDLPRDIINRIVTEDIELLRGKRADSTYQYATFERLEADRKSDSYSVQVRDREDDLQKVEINGEFAYRLIIEIPTRRLLVTKNRPLYIDRVDIDYVPQGSPLRKLESVKVEAWMKPGEVKPVDLPEVARQAVVRVYARADKEAGYSNVVLTLVQARIVDDPNSPYADAVATLKAIQKSVDNGDVPSIRAMAKRLQNSLASSVTVTVTRPPEPATRTIEVTAPQSAGLEPTPPVEIYLELRDIEDLLTASEGEKREGLDKLHQLVRRLRPR